MLQRPRPSPYRFGSGPRLTIRPLRRGRSGRWVKTGASWREVGSQYASHGEEIDPRHRAAIRALVTSSRSDLTYTGTEDVPLGSFGPDMWHQLERAVEVGVVLIGERPEDVVELSATPATASVDLTADDAGNVTVSTGFVVDDHVVAIDGEAGGLLGDPPHGLWIGEGPRLRLVPFTAPLHRTVARLVAGGPLTVPAGDVDELLDVYQPVLARHATVESSDGSVTITTSQLDGLVLVIERTALDAAVLRWYVRYRRGNRETRHPLQRPGGDGRDRAAEAAAIEALELPDRPAAHARPLRRRASRHHVHGARRHHAADRGRAVAGGEHRRHRRGGR